ncbi:MAG: prolipoprotein diacylglyceryl transferase [Gammaproteobacteria bacterium]|nr:prolipoprotein diacylglyceryl transferase [Gammaproteobacteria bacterium]
MLEYPSIDPVAIAIGPVQIRWYGICYIVGILAAWWLMNRRIRLPHYDWTREQVADLVFYATIGIIIGGRLGSVLFYNLPYYLEHPLDILKIWQGGMAFHGGLLGVILAVWIYTKHIGKSFFAATDLMAPMVPIGLGAGRIGNFINGELWGRITDMPWGMVFPQASPPGVPRHPTQLYEAFLEGLVLFIILWWFSSRPRPLMSVSGLFLLLYGLFRFGVEFFREPDAHIGYLAFDWLTMGQVLSMPMMLLGGYLLWAACHSRNTDSGRQHTAGT